MRESSMMVNFFEIFLDLGGNSSSDVLEVVLIGYWMFERNRIERDLSCLNTSSRLVECQRFIAIGLHTFFHFDRRPTIHQLFSCSYFYLTSALLIGFVFF